jgi:hypothetical protein
VTNSVKSNTRHAQGILVWLAGMMPTCFYQGMPRTDTFSAV